MARYEYHIDGNEQRMIGPSGGAAYARITGATEKTTSLFLEGWPAQWNGRVFGLEPAARYNLVERSRSLAPADSDVLITSLTAGVKVARYYETPSHIVLVLDTLAGQPPPPSPVVKLATHSTLLRAWLNDAQVPAPPVILTDADAAAGSGGTYALTLPARFVLVKQPAAAPALGAFWGTPGTNPFIERETGIDRGGAVPPWHPLQWMNVAGELLPAFIHEYGENSPQTVDYLVRVPSPTAKVKLYLCTLPSDTSAALVAINARVVRVNRETGSCNSPDGPFPIEVDVGAHYPNEILVSLILDNLAYQANDFREFSQPRFVSP